MVLILSIDIGITNLGYVYSEVTIPDQIYEGSRCKNLIFNSTYNINKNEIKENIRIIDCNRIDITEVRHRKVKFCNCKLLHDRCIPDYLDHFVQEHQDHFDSADLILIERQPPVGITNVQDLLFKTFRSKVKLISPNSVHKYFSLPGDYDIRKKCSENISMEYLQNFKRFSNNIRKHDISDALLMIIYHYKTETDIIINNSVIHKNNSVFEEFKFLQKKN
jgi:hypothetical protein